ncbi:MAG TPA: zinc-binding alcohol dehydrogenase, partial [Candidatus Dormibacteraeota bacterium]|nr:zinc-binding alcohol dehydrogenase [Candidatus Dormibacteraeota bacterium]
IGPTDVRVRALRSAISQGTEMLVYRGQVDPDLPLDLPTLKGSFRFPIKYGYASVGRVEAVGAGVDGIKEGDLVFVHHPHQSCYVVPETAAIRLPDDLEPEAGVLLANLETAITIVLDAHPRLGCRAVVFGLGVVGQLVVQLLRRAGAVAVIAVDPIERRRQLARSIGATLAIGPEAGLVQRVIQETDGVGADVAIEVSGNPRALDQAITTVTFQGTVVVASWYGTKPVSLDLGGAFHRNRVRLRSSQVSHLDPALGWAWSAARRLQLATELLGEISWAPLISHRIPLEDAPEAYRLVDERPAETVQVLLTYV